MSEVTLHLRNYYYDITNPSDPVKNFYDESISIKIHTRIRSKMNVKVTKNDYQISSGIFQYSEPESKSFYTIESEKVEIEDYLFDKLSKPGDELLTIRFEASFRVNVYETTILNLVDIFGMVGGLFEIFQVFTGVMLGLFTERLLKRDFSRANKHASENIKGWFSFPPINKTQDKNNKVHREPKDYGIFKYEIDSVLENNFWLKNFDREILYEENKEESLKERKKKELEEVRINQYNKYRIRLIIYHLQR